MKVFMIEHFLPDNLYSLELGRELKKHCDLTIFCKKSAEIKESGITWIPEFYPGGSNKAAAVVSYGVSLLKIAGMIRKGNFDVVHVQTFKNAGIEMRLYFSLRKNIKRFVYTVHNVLPHESAPKDRRLYQKFYEFCDALIVHNEASKKCLMEVFSVPEEKISVIAHGAYQMHLPPQTERENLQGLHLLQFGFIRKYKGIDILLEALSLIAPEKRKDLKVTIVGKQYWKLDDTDYEARIRELGLENCVCFVPEHIPEEKLPALFAEADYMLFPYRQIYGSGALLMAYTYGKPVIASDLAAFREETGDGKTGLLFERENPQALAEAILAASECDPEQYSRYQAAIRELVSEKYNWEKSAAMTEKVYRKLEKMATA